MLFLQIAWALIQFDLMVCPIMYDDETGSMSMECDRHPVFKLEEYNLPETLQALFKLVQVHSRFLICRFINQFVLPSLPLNVPVFLLCN